MVLRRVERGEEQRGISEGDVMPDLASRMEKLYSITLRT
jgi:hypothetical protein